MPETVHTYVRRRGETPGDPVELHYSAHGRGLQQDFAALAAAGLPKPDLLRGRLVVQNVEQAELAVKLDLHGLFTREIPREESDFYTQHPSLLGPPKIQLRPPRPHS
jgi:hypothetical protein